MLQMQFDWPFCPQIAPIRAVLSQTIIFVATQNQNRPVAAWFPHALGDINKAAVEALTQLQIAIELQKF